MKRSQEVKRLVELACQRPSEALYLMERLTDFTDAEIIHGLNIYLGRQLKEQGYSWKYAAGVVQKEAEVLRRAARNSMPLPPLKNT